MAEGTRPSESFYRRNSSSSRFPDLLISNLYFTSTKLGNGAYATVYQVEWNGTPCAAKRLHPTLLEDELPGGAERLLSTFEAECVTWSKLRHPGVVQFLGVYLERDSRLPVLIMEMMDTSLRKYLEDHSKDEFPLGSKAFVLHQITQALAYLHSQSPPLVHHDLSTNNVLLNAESFVAKLTDFGMSRSISPSVVSQKFSIRGTRVFMPPEALQNSPKYNEKLDIFSFGNIILSTITHQWPELRPPTQYKGDQLIALDEFQRREHYVEMFTAQEKQLFLPTIRQCLDNRTDKRPFIGSLVKELRHIKSTLSRSSHVATPIEQLRQQLSIKKEECRCKDKVIEEKEKVIREKDEALRKKDDRLRDKEEVLQKKEEALMKNDETFREKDEAFREVNEALWEREEAIMGKEEVISGKDEALQHLDKLVRKLDEASKEKDTTTRAQQDTIRALQASIQMQQDIIRAQQDEIERLRSCLTVSPKVSYITHLFYSVQSLILPVGVSMCNHCLPWAMSAARMGDYIHICIIYPI